VVNDAQNKAMKVILEFGLTAKARNKLPHKDKDESLFAQIIISGKEIR